MSHPTQKVVELPAEVEAVFRGFRTAEMSTRAKDGTPITWPTFPFWRPEENRFLITTSIGLPQKVFNIRRDPRVSLLYSDPTGSGLAAPPAVLVQGEAHAPDEVIVSVENLEDELEEAYRRQPAAGLYSSNALLRYLFDWSTCGS
ncbi:MAG: pyridoxamine 5'-phosphate oxidase family protein [Rubrobacteraceae bacterium]